MQKKITLLSLLATALLQLVACSAPIQQEPQVYGMPRSQFARLTPEQQQQVMQFNQQFTSAQTMTGQQVAELSSNNVQKTVVAHNKTSHGNTTTITSTSPSIGNPDLTASTPVATTPTSITPVIVNAGN